MLNEALNVLLAFAMTGVNGAVVSTVAVALGPAAAARFPAKSFAVDPTIEMPTVPSPVNDDSVTVRVVVPVPEMAAVAFAVLVLFRVISALASEIASAPV